jgi:hypothetical protein
MPSNPRRAFDARNLPSRTGVTDLPRAKNEERRDANQQNGSNRRQLK